MAKISVSKTEVPCSNQGTPATCVHNSTGFCCLSFKHLDILRTWNLGDRVFGNIQIV